ncbi:hypothetical protein ABT88_11950 [Salmonella enterica subsp. enterica serovar Typhimurium]|nr:hypothetical protein ABT88_11950 [Salmonella enterica subsp. enterica serovar Typhimurium]
MHTNADARNTICRRAAGPGARRASSARTETASTRRVGNAATVELSPGAGQNVLNIRAGIISDQEKLKYLQEYVRTQCE